MAKRQTPPRDDAPTEHVNGISGGGVSHGDADYLPSDAIEAAQSDDEETLSVILGREGFGGRIGARLLIDAVKAYAIHKPMADETDELVAAVQKADRHLQAIERFLAKSLDETLKQADAVDAARTDWSQKLNRHGRAGVARKYVQFLENTFPALFGKKPRVLHDKPVVGGMVPPELNGWFQENRLDYREFDGWKQVGKNTEEKRPVRRIVSTASVNQGSNQA